MGRDLNSSHQSDGHSSARKENDGSSAQAVTQNSKAAKVKTTGPLHNQRYKMKLCQHFELHGHCPYNEKCQFAHGQAELEKWANRRKRQAERAANAAAHAGGRRESISSVASTESNHSSSGAHGTEPLSPSATFATLSGSALPSNSSARLPSNSWSTIDEASSSGSRRTSISSLPNTIASVSAATLPDLQGPTLLPSVIATPSSSYGSLASRQLPVSHFLSPNLFGASAPGDRLDSESKEDCFSPLLSPSGIQNSPWYDEPAVVEEMRALKLQPPGFSLPGASASTSPSSVWQTPDTRSSSMWSYTPSGNTVGNEKPKENQSEQTSVPASQLFGMRTVFPSPALNSRW